MNVLSHLRGAVRRHPHLADAAIAVVVLAATAATTFTGHEVADAGTRAVALAAAVVACGALTARRRQPLAVLAVSAVAAEAFLFFTPDADGALILLAPSIALYTVAELVERRRGLVVGGSALAALTLLHALQQPGAIGAENLAFAALGALAIAAGDSSRNRRAYLAEVERRAERSELERELVARRRVEQERLRIARDLHDSVGHHLALISVQSDVAGQAINGDAAAAREAVLHVKSASRKALEELRDTVSLLRQPGDPVAPTAIPAPGLDALEELLGSLRESGLTIDYRVMGTALPLAPAADLTAYRVIQESLTNVCKHAAKREARLTLSYGRGWLRITVDDPGAGGSSLAADDSAREAPAAATPAATAPRAGITMEVAPEATAPGPAVPRAGVTGAEVTREVTPRAVTPGETAAGETAAGETAAGLPAGQQGIRGMRERLLALGGRLEAGPRPGGGFRVDAALPYQPDGIPRTGDFAPPPVGAVHPPDIAQPPDATKPTDATKPGGRAAAPGRTQPTGRTQLGDGTQPGTGPKTLAGAARRQDAAGTTSTTSTATTDAALPNQPGGIARSADLVPPPVDGVHPADIDQPTHGTKPADGAQLGGRAAAAGRTQLGGGTKPLTGAETPGGAARRQDAASTTSAATASADTVTSASTSSTVANAVGGTVPGGAGRRAQEAAGHPS